MSAPTDSLIGQARAVAYGATAALLAMALLAIAQSSSSALTAIALGVLFALALDPVARAVQRRMRCSRAIATLVIGAAIAIAGGVVTVLLAPTAVDQASKFAEELPSTIEELYTWPVVGDRLERWDALGRAETFFDELPDRFDADAIAGVADRSFGVLTTALIVLTTTVAVLLDGEALVERIRRIIPQQHQERADQIGAIVYRSVARYFAGSIGVALLNGSVMFVLALVLGVPLAPLIGIWSAITNLIPQVGGFLGGAFLVLLATTQGVVIGLIALGVFLAYQQLENNVIQPTVIGKAVDLTPPTTMLAALVGGATAGVPGALVATPLIGAAKSVWLDTRNRSDESQPHVDEPSVTAES